MMTDADIRRLVASEASRVADERIKAALAGRRNMTDDDLSARLKGTRHENDDHLDRALLPIKIKPGEVDAVLESRSGDAVWSSDSASLGIPRSLLTTKGDLLGRTSSAVVRKGVGTNTYVLTADSTQADGLAWAAQDGVNAWTTLFDGSCRFPAGTANGSYIMAGGGLIANGGTIVGVDSMKPHFYLQPTDYAAPAGRTLQFRFLGTIMNNATAPFLNIELTAFPITALGGGAGNLNLTFGGTRLGSAAATFLNPAANNGYVAASSTFTGPTAGFYCWSIITTGGAGSSAANSYFTSNVCLQYRHA